MVGVAPEGERGHTVSSGPSPLTRLWLRLVRFWRGSLAVVELDKYPLPLYLRRSAGLGPPEPQRVATCSACGVRYFERAPGSHLPEDGRCRACATGRRPAARVEPLVRPHPQRRPAGWKR